MVVGYMVIWDLSMPEDKKKKTKRFFIGEK